VKRTAAAAALLLPGLWGCASLGVKEGGFNLISLDEEWAMRGDMQRQVAQQMKLVNDPRLLAYLNQLGRSLTRQTSLGDRQWDFGIVRDDAVNAFNLPGGLVYVNSGLIRRASALDQLAGVMAHEIGHGTARHGTQLMTRAYGYNLIAALVLGQDAGQKEQILASLVGTGILQNYSRDAEREADHLGVGYAYSAGYDPKGIPDLFRTLLELRQQKPSALEQFFASHPVTEERIATTESQIAGLPHKKLTHDTREYQDFRGRVP
jgi:predicted Zn-dependent protease